MIRNIKQLAELAAILYCLSGLFGCKLRIGLHAVVYIIVNLAIFIGINDYGIPVVFVLAAHLSLLVYAFANYRKSIKVTLLNCFLTAVFVSAAQLLFYLPVNYFARLCNYIGEWNDLLINLGCFLTMWIVSKTCKMELLSEFLLKKNRILNGIVIFIMICLGKELWRAKQDMALSIFDYAQIVSFLVLFLFAMKEWHKAQMDAERKRIQLEMDQLYYSAYDELLTVIRERQHDMKNHINAIYSMIYTIDNYEDLVREQKEYCQCIMDKNEQTKLLLSVENPLVVGFLYKKIQEAEEKGIKVEYKVSMGERSDNVPSYEIVEILSVLIDNAIEALEKTTLTDRKIYIDLNCREQKMYISVANTSECMEQQKMEQLFERNFSTKGMWRGLGLKKIKKLVHEKEGEIIVSNEDYDYTNFLQFSIMLPIG